MSINSTKICLKFQGLKTIIYGINKKQLNFNPMELCFSLRVYQKCPKMENDIINV